jgi:hypothetical protein
MQPYENNLPLIEHGIASSGKAILGMTILLQIKSQLTYLRQPGCVCANQRLQHRFNSTTEETLITFNIHRARIDLRVSIPGTGTRYSTRVDDSHMLTGS